MTRIIFLRIGILTQWIHVAGVWSPAQLLDMSLLCKNGPLLFYCSKYFVTVQKEGEKLP